MAPLPKPRGQRVKRGPQAQWRDLPADGRKGKAPALPSSREWSQETRSWWRTIWASPMAVAWLDADVDPLVRLAALKDDWARGKAPAVALPAMQQLEDRFGLSPKARRALQWEVSKVEAEPALAVVEARPLRVVRGG